MTGWGNLYLIGVRGILFHGVEQPKSCMEEAPTYFDIKIQVIGRVCGPALMFLGMS